MYMQCTANKLAYNFIARYAEEDEKSVLCNQILWNYLTNFREMEHCGFASMFNKQKLFLKGVGK